MEPLNAWSNDLRNMSSLYNTPTKPIIVVDINFLPSEDKTNPENIEVKYNKLFDGYIVIYIDSSKHNTMSNSQYSYPPIYKL